MQLFFFCSGLAVCASDCGVRRPRFESRRGRLCLSRQPLWYTALGTGCAVRTFSAVPRLTVQPSTLRGTIKWVSAYGLSNNNNGDGGCGCMHGSSQFSGLTSQVDWLGLRVGGHSALSLHSSNKPVNFVHDDSTTNIVVVIIVIIIIIFNPRLLGRI